MVFRDEEDTKKLIVFYIVYTCIYFPILICLIIWGKGVDVLGKYHFKSFLFMIIVAEAAKFFVSRLHSQRKDVNLTKKMDNSVVSIVCRMIFNRSTFKDGIKTIFIVLSMIMLFVAIAILYGAEFLDKHEETLMFGSLLSILTTFPMCLNLGPFSVYPLLLGIKPTDKLEALMAQNMVFTLCGAWLGAIAIPLDWDRPWQVWPIPCSIGAMLGFLASHVAMIHRLRTNPPKKRK